MRRLILVALAGAFVAAAFAQGEYPVTLVTPDGSHVPFALNAQSVGGLSVPALILSHDNTGSTWGRVYLVVGGADTPMPVDLLARLELVRPGEETVWRATLRDGRVFDAASGRDAKVRLVGVNEFGVGQDLTSYSDRPGQQTFVGVVFDPTTLTDTVYLTNGDVLHGSAQLATLGVATPYGALVFERGVLERVVVGGGGPAGADLVRLRTGDRISGLVQGDAVRVALAAGGDVVVPWGDVRSVTFAWR